MAPIKVYLTVAAGPELLIVVCSAFRLLPETKPRDVASRRFFRDPNKQSIVTDAH